MNYQLPIPNFASPQAKHNNIAYIHSTHLVSNIREEIK